MLGKFAAVLGPLMIAVVSLASGSHRWGMLSIVLLFLLGGGLLLKVDASAAKPLKR